MKLVEFTVTNFKSIEDSGVIKVDDVTCIVGKNESGKTALFEALTRLNPVEGLPKDFDHVEDYPRRKLNEYKRRHDESPDTVVDAAFDLTEDEVKEVEEEFGEGILRSRRVTVSKDYANHLKWGIQIDEGAHVRHRIQQAGVGEPHAKMLSKEKSITDLAESAEGIEDSTESVQKLIASLKGDKQPLFEMARAKIASEYLPEFFYFDEYSTLQGTLSLNALKKSQAKKKASEEDLTALALIELVGASIDEFLDRNNYERLKANLEAASNEITDQVFKYWTQNTSLSVEFDLQPVTDANNVLIDTNLKIRIRNQRHRVTVDFDKRSRGFVWFFSFLVAFSKFRKLGGRLILLLDEPGLNLHAKAQGDLLRFVDVSLAPHHQVLYSTHSPFMINAALPARIRTVQDVDDKGTQVSSDPFQTDADTLFPLQAALGYDLTQTLFVAPNTLLVEGPSDLIYLTHASAVLENAGRQGLKKEWVVVPVGGADKVSTFVSLLGANKLNVVLFLDVSQNAQQRISSLLERNLVMTRNLITVGSVIGSKNADIEDMFAPDRYLDLVNATFDELKGKPIKTSEISKGDPRIVKRLEAHFSANGIADGGFSHYRPAQFLMMNSTTAKKLFDGSALDNFEKAFTIINSLLKT